MLATLLVGSVKGPKSTSDALGSFLLEKLEARGVRTRKLFIAPSLASGPGVRQLLDAAAESDLIVLAAPLFVDSLSASVVKAYELIGEDIKRRGRKRRSLIAISNCGFPEAHQNNIALAISRRFARECGFEWAGGLALGAGGAINGRRLEEAGGFVKNVMKSLEMTAKALAKGDSVPEEAIELMAKPMMPMWMYLTIGAHPLRVWWTLLRNGCRDSARLQPYRGGNS